MSQNKYIITNDLRDDVDISKQTRLVYVRANMLLRKFSAARILTYLFTFYPRDAGLCDSDVSVRPSVRPSVRLSHAGIVPSRAKAGS